MTSNADKQRAYRKRVKMAQGLELGKVGRPLAPHGHAARYNRGCRCGLCTEANRLKGVAWRASKRATND